MLGIIHPFVRRREPGQHTTFFAELHSLATSPEGFAPDRATDFDPVVYSRFTGGRGRRVYPASQDVLLYFNPGTRMGGEGSSFQQDHNVAGKAVIPSSLLAVGRTRAINYPRTLGKFPWASRTNTYRPPSQSFSEASDQAGDDPDYPGNSDYVQSPL